MELAEETSSIRNICGIYVVAAEFKMLGHSQIRQKIRYCHIGLIGNRRGMQICFIVIEGCHAHGKKRSLC